MSQCPGPSAGESTPDRGGSIFLPLLVALLYARPSYAYIDPGTGSALVYIVTAVIVSLFFAIRGLYYRTVELVFRARWPHQKCNIAIHCEDPRYEITFLPVIRALARRGIELTLFTMYHRDTSFEPLPETASHQPISSGIAGYAYLNHLEANILVTTTPQLDVMTFRRSKRVKHYCHIPHALGESIYVRPYAYDFFDSVLCCGRILKTNIRKIEFIRKLPAKQLYATGIPHYDELLKQSTEAQDSLADSHSRRRTVLIAPSWGPLSIFQAFGTSFLRKITESFDVVVRPHPQMRISQPGIYAKILALDGVTVDTETTPARAMSRADVLVSDISGIMHEFAFIYEKPVIFVDHQTGLGGLEGQLIGGVSELKKRCLDFIVPIAPSQIDRLAERIHDVLGREPSNQVAEARADVVYNFGNAGSMAAEQLEEILQCLS